MENPREKEYIFCPTCKFKLVRKKIDKRNLLSCPNCYFIFWNNPKPVTSMIIEKEGRILMIKRNKEPLKGYWVLPGGYIDYDEKPDEAIIREFKEETNLDVKTLSLIGVYLINNDPNGNNIDIIYSGKVVGGKIKINEESTQFDFFGVDELPELIAYKHREAIKEWASKKMDLK